MKNIAIKQIGVELEGLWKDVNPIRAWAKGDGSVCGISREGLGDIPNFHNGECASTVFNTLEEVLVWTRTFYPHRTNRTCGLHIHISTITPEQYALLIEPEFFLMFSNELKNWGKKICGEEHNEDNENFWYRYNGNNGYCARINQSVNQINGNGGRSQLNFSSWHRHKTLECRVFPAFQDLNKSLAAINFFYDLVNYYIANAKATVNTTSYLQSMRVPPSQPVNIPAPVPNVMRVASYDFELVNANNS